MGTIHGAHYCKERPLTTTIFGVLAIGELGHHNANHSKAVQGPDRAMEGSAGMRPRHLMALIAINQ